MTTDASQRRGIAARAIAELVEQLWHATSNRGFATGLNPAQWTALRYLDRVSEGARSVGAFAEFHRTPPSSASQTFSALVKRGLVAKEKGTDSRQRLLTLTRAGREILKQDPLDHLADAITQLSERQLTSLTEIMEKLARASFPDETAKPKKSS
jgi:DNA-binding MarR family transcriptional regulator